MDEFLADRIAMLERHVDWLYSQAGYAPPYSGIGLDGVGPGKGFAQPMAGPRVSEEVMRHVRARKQINAVKQYRAETGVGLKEAKEAVDAITAEYRAGRLR